MTPARLVRPVCLAGQRTAKRHQLAHVAGCPGCSQTALNRAALGTSPFAEWAAGVSGTSPTKTEALMRWLSSEWTVTDADRRNAAVVHGLVRGQHHAAVAPLAAPAPLTITADSDGLAVVSLAACLGASSRGPTPQPRRPLRALRLTARRQVRTLVASPAAPPTGRPVVER